MTTIEELLGHKLTALRNTGAVSAAPAEPNKTVTDNVSVATSVTVLDVDPWGMRQGEDISGDGYDPVLMADCHHALFDPKPELAENPRDKTRAKWFADLLESDSYRSLHASTMYDKGLSGIAATTIADQWKSYLKSIPPADRDKPKDSIEEDLRRIESINSAVESAKLDVDSAYECARGFGDAPAIDGKLDPARVAAAFKAIRDDAQLRRIFELGGRFRRYAMAIQKSKVKHGYDDMIGVHLNDCIPRMVTSELARLADVDLELDLCKRLVDKQVLCREYEGEDKLALGPIVVVVDESSSMDDEPVEQAKGLALGMGWVALHQKRWISFIGYSGGHKGNILTMPPGRWNQAALIEWLQHFYGGGSSMDLPIRELPTSYWSAINPPKGKTDVLFITDARCDMSDTQKKTFNDWKSREQVKCYGLVINSRPGHLADICEKTWVVDGITLSEDGVKEVLAI